MFLKFVHTNRFDDIYYLKHDVYERCNKTSHSIPFCPYLEGRNLRLVVSAQEKQFYIQDPSTQLQVL